MGHLGGRFKGSKGIALRRQRVAGTTLDVFKSNAADLFFGGEVHGGGGKVVEQTRNAFGEFGEELDGGCLKDLGGDADLLQAVRQIVVDAFGPKRLQTKVEGDPLT